MLGRDAEKDERALDRFGRSLRHLVNALAEFESLGIAFVSLSDNLDLSAASGRLMFNTLDFGSAR
jgi:DNA invertase Pin-like site-specific DNA recombinase